MKRFRTFLLSEASPMAAANLQKKLKAAGFNKIVQKTRNLALVYVDPKTRKIEFENLLGLLQKDQGYLDNSPTTMRRVSSMGAIAFEGGPFKGLMVGIKPDKSQALSTDEQETLQGIFIATKLAFPRTTFTYEDLEKYGDANVSSRYKIATLYEKAGKGWIQSSTNAANAIAGLYSGIYKVQQRSGSRFENRLSNAAKKLIKESGHVMGLDKWNPADIWLVKPSLVEQKFDTFKSIVELNEFLLEKYKSKEIIGVSLKASGKTVKVEVFNDGVKNEINFTEINVGNFATALAANVKFAGGSIDIRNFGRPESVSGEIAGKYAAGGKIGAGPLMRVMKSIVPTFETPTHQQISAMDENEVITYLYTMMKRLAPNQAVAMSQDEYRDVVLNKSNKVNYMISRYQNSDILLALSKMSTDKKNDFIDKVLSYASSSTEISSIFIKVS